VEAEEDQTSVAV